MGHRTYCTRALTVCFVLLYIGVIWEMENRMQTTVAYLLCCCCYCGPFSVCASILWIAEKGWGVRIGGARLLRMEEMRTFEPHGISIKLQLPGLVLRRLYSPVVYSKETVHHNTVENTADNTLSRHLTPFTPNPSIYPSRKPLNIPSPPTQRLDLYPKP